MLSHDGCTCLQEDSNFIEKAIRFIFRQRHQPGLCG